MHQSPTQFQMTSSSMFDHQSGSPIQPQQPQHAAFSQPSNNMVAIQQVPFPATTFGYSNEQHLSAQYYHHQPQHPQYQTNTGASVK